MKIETKFDIGKKVWIMKDNKCYSFSINDINVKLSRCPTCDIGNYYKINQIVEYKGYETDWYNENELFATKEDLIKSL